MRYSLKLRAFSLLALVAAASLFLAPIKASASCAWSISRSPNYDLSKFGSGLGSVSADSATDAWAVGSYQNAKTGFNYTLAERWNGANWQIVSTPNPAIDPQFSGVVALTTNNAWAVGSYYIQSPNATTGLIEHWNGKSWSVVSSPASASLSSIKAVSANDIWAVGQDQQFKTLIVHWNGITWSRVASPNYNVAKNSSLGSVSASGPNDVWAVGSYYDNNIKTYALTEHWDGTKWNLISKPAPTTSDYSLSGVAALSAKDVFDVGDYYPSGSFNPRTLGEHWNGVRWVIQATPNHGDQGTQFHNVAAVSPTEVIAVGEGTALVGNQVYSTTFTARWTGTQWVTTSTPNATANDALFGASTIPGTNDVWAVGATFTLDGLSNPYATLIERYHC